MPTETPQLLATFAENVRARRERSGKSVDEIAARVPCTPNAWRKWEAADRWPGPASLAKIAAALGVKPGRLLD